MGASHLRVLVAMMEYSVPPADMQEPARKDLDRLNDWLAEADVMEALAALGHEVESVGVREDLAVLRKALE
ncbi:MAG: D-alanine--D-alanine ligase, partial [Planctomycetota bacterium]